MATASSTSGQPKIVEDFIRQVRAALARKKMQVTELAEQSGVSREYIQRLLAGRQNPSLEIAAKIAKPLDLSVQTVVKK